MIQDDDEVFFLADARNITTVMSELRRLDSRPTRRLLIAGGGNIGRKLARSLENRYQVKVLERSRDRARGIAEELLNSIVLVGDCADEDLLREENIDQTDVYMALTNDDEANILSAMLAKRLGCPRVLALINRPSYAELVEGGSIDIAVSPQQVTLSARCSRISARARRRACTRCAAAPPRRSRRWCAATAAPRGWSAARSRNSTCPRRPPSAASCAATSC